MDLRDLLLSPRRHIVCLRGTPGDFKFSGRVSKAAGKALLKSRAFFVLPDKSVSIRHLVPASPKITDAMNNVPNFPLGEVG
jgi:hypothetical protein